MSGVFRLLSAFLIVSGLLVGGPAQLWAGGALKTNIDGLPLRWGNTIVFNPEQGSIKPGVIDHNESVQMVKDAFALWQNVPGVDLNISEGSDLPDGGDTNLGNYKEFYAADLRGCYDSDPGTPCYTPIIFDADGSIMEDIFGECKQFSMLGVAGYKDLSGNSSDPKWLNIKAGWAIFSGACVEPVVNKPGCGPCNQIVTQEQLRALITHELGHLLGLAHTQVNPQSYQSCLDNGSCPDELAEDIPTMFPMMLAGGGQVTLHRDDIVSMQRLYGNPDSEGCEISGRVLAQDGTTELRGVEVLARNSLEFASTEDAVSYVSGEEAPRLTADDTSAENCLFDCGQYHLKALKPGETYQVCVQRILSKFTGSRFIPPVQPPFQGVDEVCPEALTFTCDCPGGICEKFTDVDIVTSNEGLDLSNSSLGDFDGPAGGCSLIRERQLKVWKPLVLTLVRMVP